MPESKRQEEYLYERLRSFGIALSVEPGAASGEIPLSATPLPTLEKPIRLERARFYTLRHKFLKFYQPAVLFDLPPIDVSRCHSADDIESCLRRAWSTLQRELQTAKSAFDALGVAVETAVQGTRLRTALTDDDAKVEIRSNRELLLPSSGALAEVALTAPDSRRFRPPSGLNPVELELAIGAEMERNALSARPEVPAQHSGGLSLDDPDVTKQERRVLVVANAGPLRDQLISQLPARDLLPDIPKDPSRALHCFDRHSYELVLVQAQMPRVDGFELTARLRGLAGVDRLPIVLMDERSRDASRLAAEAAGASVYLPGPYEWDDVASTLLDMLDHAHMRRFSRYRARLAVRTAGRDRYWEDLTESVGRAGLCLRTQREVEPGSVEIYTINLPGSLGQVEVAGEVVSRVTLPGYASVLAGVRLLRFHGESEARWIHLIGALDRQPQR